MLISAVKVDHCRIKLLPQRRMGILVDGEKERCLVGGENRRHRSDPSPESDTGMTVIVGNKVLKPLRLPANGRRNDEFAFARPGNHLEHDEPPLLRCAANMLQQHQASRKKEAESGAKQPDRQACQPALPEDGRAKIPSHAATLRRSSWFVAILRSAAHFVASDKEQRRFAPGVDVQDNRFVPHNPKKVR